MHFEHTHTCIHAWVCSVYSCPSPRLEVKSIEDRLLSIPIVLSGSLQWMVKRNQGKKLNIFPCVKT